MQINTLERTCYVIGAGAFGVFIRWMQDMMAFDDAGLSEKSFWNIMLPLYMIIAAITFLRYVDSLRNKHYYMPDDFCSALRNEGKFFRFLRWAVGIIMAGGALVLLATCETDKNADLLKILAYLGIPTGLSFPIVLTAANRPQKRPGYLSLCAALPVIFYSYWLIVSYKINAINPNVWAYTMEIIAIIFSMVAFFRIAGFAFDTPNVWRSLFFAMLDGALCIMVLADERYMGMQIMFLASAMMMVLYNWILLSNLQKGDAPQKISPNDGFERL